MDTNEEKQTTNPAEKEIENPDENAATILIELENSIKNNVSGIARRKADAKKLKEMLSSVLTNDATYTEHDKNVKEATKIRNTTRSELLKLPENRKLAEDLKDISTEIKEMELALSDYLGEYRRLSDSNEIETDDGEVMEIVYTAKLIKKSSRK